MKFGVLSDIHGNRTALEAVLADGRRNDIDGWWALGDLVAVGPDPRGTLEVLTNLPDAAALKGNTERYVITGDRPPPLPSDVVADNDLLGLLIAVEQSFSWTRDALAGTGWLEWLEGLPTELRCRLPDGTRVMGVHCTPDEDDGDGITPTRSAADLLDALRDAHADIVIGGHSHQPTDRRVGDIRAVNSGSVSNPITDDLRASYVILHADADRHRIEHRRVAYDVEAFRRVVERSDHPEPDYILSFQRGERRRR